MVSQMRSWAAAHPRSRGENTCGLARADMVEGSSPLTRGKPPVSAGGHEGPGLIPAHAGKTPSHRATNPTPAAHPRSRGENFPKRIGSWADSGSSPLTRGKRLRCSVGRAGDRLIPAHAGKTHM